MTTKKSLDLRTKIYYKIRKDGILALITIAPQYFYLNHLRQYLLTHTKIVLYNGVESPYQVSILDRIIPIYCLPEDRPTYESAEMNAVKKYTQKDDRVIIVGAGRGITATVAANSVGDGGQVIAYEASIERISRTKKTIQHNQVNHIVELHHKIVSENKDVSGYIGSPSTISPSELPSCDFLELDCEGAEASILKEMTENPRIISVETHETKGVSHSDIIELLKNRGYQITEETDKTDQHEGIRHIVAVIEK